MKTFGESLRRKCAICSGKKLPDARPMKGEEKIFVREKGVLACGEWGERVLFT